MGEILRKVKVCGLDVEGNVRGCRVVDAIVDTGATQSVIGSELAHELGGQHIGVAAMVEGHKVPGTVLMVELDASRCTPQAAAVIVDDGLAERAAPAQMVLGHDYMQRTRVGILFSNEPAETKVACHPRRAAKSRKR
jgi:hypothetical protein